MALRGALLAVLFVVGAGVGDAAAQAPSARFEEHIDAILGGLAAAQSAEADGRHDQAVGIATRLYLDHYEIIEGFYGPGGTYAVASLERPIAIAETRFHAVLGAEGDDFASAVEALLVELDRLRDLAPEAQTAGRVRDVAAPAGPDDGAPEHAARTPEVIALAADLNAARSAYVSGDRAAAAAGVERAYLERFELLEPRLSSATVGRVERLIHLELRPAIAAGASAAEVDAMFDRLTAELTQIDRELSAENSFWFGAVNAFLIIVREGLEAVLLIGAILAYLGSVGAENRHRRQVYMGVAAGVVASLGTWLVARALVPLDGASRELLEGVTALLAVGVLVYVSHWLFQKTYLHDWKEYLNERVGMAVTTGSAFLLAGLAFAAVYREGFETVLFYQALLFDAGPGAVVAGFVPGLVLIVGVGYGIIRFGMRLPLRRVFAVTNAILLYLAFTFLGKGLYNLQEAGVFTATPWRAVPDTGITRQLLGLYPIAETVLAQLAFMVLVVGMAVVYRARSRARAPEQSAAAELEQLAES